MAYLKTTCDHGPLEKAPQDARFSARLRRLLLERQDSDRAIHWPDGFSFSTPAEGDGYDFSVNVQFVWCATGATTVERLIDRAKENHPGLRDRLLGRIRRVSRETPPYEAAMAEDRIAGVISDVFAQAQFEYVTAQGFNGRVQPIGPRTIVKPDETIRRAQQEAWDRRLAAENDHAFAKRLVPLLTSRRDLWQSFLETGQGRWTTPHAVSLAETPKAIGATVQQMFGERREQARELAEQITEQTQEYGELNAFELMIRNDTVLRRLMDLMGIDQPPELGTGPFGPGEENRSNGEARA